MAEKATNKFLEDLYSIIKQKNRKLLFLNFYYYLIIHLSFFCNYITQYQDISIQQYSLYKFNLGPVHMT